MADTCMKHSFEPAAGVCRQCKNSYCTDCLIFAFGEKKPPYCVMCALNVAGIRQQGAKPNPRLRKKGFLGRKVLVDEAPRQELGFDDIQIELPSLAMTPPVMSGTTRREVDPEVLAMVQAAESGHSDSGPRPQVAGIDNPDPEQAGTLADWAASLSGEPLTTDQPAMSATAADMRSESSTVEAWPEESSRSGF